jgi:hypothetical protein
MGGRAGPRAVAACLALVQVVGPGRRRTTFPPLPLGVARATRFVLVEGGGRRRMREGEARREGPLTCAAAALRRHQLKATRMRPARAAGVGREQAPLLRGGQAAPGLGCWALGVGAGGGRMR